MTFDEALKVFGLAEKPDSEKLNAIYKAMQKIAFIKGDDAESKRLNIARDILLGKSEAENLDISNNAPAIHGHTTAHCSKEKILFVVDWQFTPDQNKGDQIVFSNPRSMFEPDLLEKTVKKIRNGVFFKHLFRKKEPEQSWPSDFQAELLFENTHCHICKAKFLQWCKHCNSIFCHLSREEYAPEYSYNCPECDAQYGWGEGFGAKPKTLFDAKDLRSIGSNKRFLPGEKLKMIGNGG